MGAIIYPFHSYMIGGRHYYYAISRGHGVEPGDTDEGGLARRCAGKCRGVSRRFYLRGQESIQKKEVDEGLPYLEDNEGQNMSIRWRWDL